MQIVVRKKGLEVDFFLEKLPTKEEPNKKSPIIRKRRKKIITSDTRNDVQFFYVKTQE